jgi:hypothetical protein
MHTYSKIKISLKEVMKPLPLQIDESTINETFASTNNVFDEFREFSSSENFLK